MTQVTSQVTRNYQYVCINDYVIIVSKITRATKGKQNTFHKHVTSLVV